MKMKMWSILGVAHLLAAPLVAAQNATPEEEVRKFEGTLNDLTKEGIDSQSPEYSALQNDVSEMRRLAKQIKEKKGKNDLLQKKIESMERDLQTNGAEIQRLTEQIKQQLAALMEERQRLDMQRDVYNRTQARTYRLPDEQAGYDACQAEYRRLVNWERDLIARAKASENGADMKRLAELSKRWEAIRAEIEDSKNQIANIRDDASNFEEKNEDAHTQINKLREHLKVKHVLTALTDQGAFGQLLDVVQEGGRRYDTELQGDRARTLPNYSPPPAVTDNQNYRRVKDDQQSRETQISNLKAEIFAPGATREKIEENVKKMTALQSENHRKRFEENMMASPAALQPTAIWARRSVDREELLPLPH